MATAAGRYGNLDRSFKLAARSLLTAFSREDVNKAFSSFTAAERERLYQMFIYVIKSLHGNVEEEFQTFCQEIEVISRAILHHHVDRFQAHIWVQHNQFQVSTALEKVDQFVEERSLDVLSSDKTSIEEIKERISQVKKDEIEHLKGLLEKAEERNNAMKARIKHLKEGEDFNASRNVLDKLKQWNSACQGYNNH